MIGVVVPAIIVVSTDDGAASANDGAASTGGPAGGGTDALRLLPANTALVITWNVRRTGRSAAGRAIVAALLRSGEIAEKAAKLRTRAGLSIERDIDTAIVAMADDFAQSRDIAVVLGGRFAESAVITAARQASSSFASARHRGAVYYVLDGDTALAFLDGYLVITPKDTMVEIIDVYRGTSRSAVSTSALTTLLPRGPTGSDLWAVFVIPAKLRADIARDTGGHSVEAVMAKVDMQSGLSLRIRLHLSSRQAASAVAVLLRKSAADAAGTPELAALGLARPLSSASVQQTGSRLDVQLDVPRGTVDKIVHRALGPSTK
ncbi:MAG: hypothetical protein MJE77_21040 [Proteobacteria bacterium]|nr:hypothetical protein [Pseudomonadota bacterium]